MSKGLGRVERAVLQLLYAWKQRSQFDPARLPTDTPLSVILDIVAVESSLTAIEITAKLYLWETEYWTNAQYTVVRRALATLLRKGLVQCDDRNHRQAGRRSWGLSDLGIAKVYASDGGYGEFDYDPATGLRQRVP